MESARVARVVMDQWTEDMEVGLERGKVEIFLLVKYMNNVDVVTEIIPKGWKWVEGETGKRILIYSAEESQINRQESGKRRIM